MKLLPPGKFPSATLQAQLVVPLHLPHTHAARVHRNDLLIEARKSSSVLRYQLRLKAALAVPRNRQLDRFDLRQYRLFAVAVAVVGRLAGSRNLAMRRI